MISFSSWFDQRITRQLGTQKKPIILGLVCTAVAALLTTLNIPLIYAVISAVERGEAHKLTYLSIGAIMIFATKYWFARGQFYFLNKTDIQLTSNLRKTLYNKLQQLPLNYFDDKRAGAIQSVLTNDVNVYHNAIMSAMYSIEGPVKLFFGFIFITLIQWKLAMAVVGAIPIFMFVIQRNRKRTRTAQSKIQADLSDMTAMMQESLQGIRVIKAYGAEANMCNQFGKMVDRCKQSQLMAAYKMAALKPTVELVGACVAALTIYFCGQLVYSGELNVAQLSAFLLGLDMINQGARSVGDLFQTFSQMQSATDRIYEQILDVPIPQQNTDSLKALPSSHGKVEFRNISFTYPDGTEALKNLSFILEPSSSLAIVGPSGAGKSTIADLLLGFYQPTSGQILYDDTDLQELDPHWLRNQIGVVPQETFLFAGTIGDNLRLGAPHATQEAIELAAKAAHAEPFILQMPNQFDTQIGERGVTLSGGEAQRLAIARAVAKQPKLLLLDEATSNLDAVSEKIVQEALEGIMKDRTSLFIAHRLSTAARANKIIMLRKGEIVEMGSHQELLAANGAYAGMYAAYTSGVLDSAIE